MNTLAPSQDNPNKPLSTVQASEGTLQVVEGSDDDQGRRKAILKDPAVHRRMRKAIRGRGVPRDQVNDVLHDVIADVSAHLSLLPVDPKAARKYLCVVARNHSIDNAHARKKDGKPGGESGPGGADHEEIGLEEVSRQEPDLRTPPVDQIVDARLLAEHATRRFPVTFPWFLRKKVGGEEHAEIARDVNRSPETVRQKIAEVGRALAGSDGTKVGLAFLAVLFFLVIGGMRHWRLPGGVPVDQHERTANSATPPVTPPPPAPTPTATPLEDDPVALRALGKEECAKGQWDTCVDDLTRANHLDRSGETPELAKLLDHAFDKLDSFEAKPGERAAPHHHTPGSQLTPQH